MGLPFRLYNLLRSKIIPSLSFNLNFHHPPPFQEQPSDNQSQIHHLPSSSKQETEQNQIQNTQVLPSQPEEEKKEIVEEMNEETFIKLKHHISELEDIDDIIHKLNTEGEKDGVIFKKGTIQKWDDGSFKYKSIICSHINRNFNSVKQIFKKEGKRSLENEQSQKNSASKCKAFYRLKYEQKTEKFLGIISYHEGHKGHGFKIKKKELTEAMIEEIKHFKKNANVSQIKDFLENRFKVDLNYSAVYNEYKKAFPLLGPEDAQNFLLWCQEHNFEVAKHIDESNPYYTKLFVCSDLMKAHFKCYGDVVIVDATYRTNKYKLPIILFSGFTHKGRNCLFGFGIVNDESEETYSWIFKEFFRAHNSQCSIIVTDHDLAMESVIDKNYQSITHLLCLWHIIQSFTKHFSFLTSLNCSTLKNQILSLPYIETEKEFEEVYSQIQKTLDEKKLTKSSNYLEKMHIIRKKWGEAFLPAKFTGGVHSTSRAESMNSLIKRYVNSKSEIYDLIVFLKDFEKTSIYNDFKLSKEIVPQYENHPIINELKKCVFETIFSKHFEQFSLSHNYFCKLKLTNSITSIYEAKNIQAKDAGKFREVMLNSGKYSCECKTYNLYGVICRHIFALSIMLQDKDLIKFTIHKRWQMPLSSDHYFQLQIDNFDFDTALISAFLKQNIVQLASENQEEQKENDKKLITFQKTIKVRGAPKKEKRIKSAVEKTTKKNKKKVQKKGKLLKRLS